MNARLVAWIASCAISGAALAAAPGDYAYVFPIRTAGTSNAWRIDLTPAVYAWTQDRDLGDIEVFNADGRSVPLARIATEPATTARERRAPLPVLALPPAALGDARSDLRLVIDRDAAGRLRRIDAGEAPAAAAPRTRDWLVDASGVDHAIDDITLRWREPASGVVARFSIEASEDLEHWRDAARGTVLALEQDGAHLERRDIALGGLRAKYLRLHRIDEGVDLDGVAVEARFVERSRALPNLIWIEAMRSVGPDATHAGNPRFDYALGAPLPIEAARIELATDNALAPLTLFAQERGRDARELWTPLATETAFRLRVGEDLLRNGDVAIGHGPRRRVFRIEAAAPLAEAPRLSLAYRPDRLVFLAEGPAPYTLAVGSVTARRASYPVAAALATLRARLGRDWEPPEATLGDARPSGGAAALEARKPPIRWQRLVLWTILVAGALLVAGFALTLLRASERGRD